MFGWLESAGLRLPEMAEKAAAGTSGVAGAAASDCFRLSRKPKLQVHFSEQRGAELWLSSVWPFHFGFNSNPRILDKTQ
jgi:hypothetical protein